MSHIKSIASASDLKKALSKLPQDGEEALRFRAIRGKRKGDKEETGGFYVGPQMLNAFAKDKEKYLSSQLFEGTIQRSVHEPNHRLVLVTRTPSAALKELARDCLAQAKLQAYKIVTLKPGEEEPEQLVDNQSTEEVSSIHEEFADKLHVYASWLAERNADIQKAMGQRTGLLVKADFEGLVRLLKEARQKLIVEDPEGKNERDKKLWLEAIEKQRTKLKESLEGVPRETKPEMVPNSIDVRDLKEHLKTAFPSGFSAQLEKKTSRLVGGSGKQFTPVLTALRLMEGDPSPANMADLEAAVRAYLQHAETDYSDKDRNDKINQLKINTAEKILRDLARLRELQEATSDPHAIEFRYWGGKDALQEAMNRLEEPIAEEEYAQLSTQQRLELLKVARLRVAAAPATGLWALMWETDLTYIPSELRSRLTTSPALVAALKEIGIVWDEALDETPVPPEMQEKVKAELTTLNARIRACHDQLVQLDQEMPNAHKFLEKLDHKLDKVVEIVRGEIASENVPTGPLKTFTRIGGEREHAEPIESDALEQTFAQVVKNLGKLGERWPRGGQILADGTDAFFSGVGANPAHKNMRREVRSLFGSIQNGLDGIMQELAKDPPNPQVGQLRDYIVQQVQAFATKFPRFGPAVKDGVHEHILGPLADAGKLESDDDRSQYDELLKELGDQWEICGASLATEARQCFVKNKEIGAILLKAGEAMQQHLDGVAKFVSSSNIRPEQGEEDLNKLLHVVQSLPARLPRFGGLVRKALIERCGAPASRAVKAKLPNGFTNDTLAQKLNR